MRHITILTSIILGFTFTSPSPAEESPAQAHCHRIKIERSEAVDWLEMKDESSCLGNDGIWATHRPHCHNGSSANVDEASDQIDCRGRLQGEWADNTHQRMYSWAAKHHPRMLRPKLPVGKTTASVD